MTALERHLSDMGLMPKPKPAPVRQWGGWKPTKEQPECPW
jgi:hypothetical protein